MTVHYKRYKAILSASNGMNLYRGCTHGCIYCDSRSLCYQMDHDFEDVEVKEDAPALLEEALLHRRKPCMIGTGAMSDPYIPLERELRRTRRCLEVIARHGFGLAIQTKSSDILWDLDLLTAIHRRAKCVVQMTLTTADEALCRIVEPNVCGTAERVRTLQVLRDHDIPTVVWLTPILPFLNDAEENLTALLDACEGAGVRGVIWFGAGMTLRDGDREYYYQKLDEHFPGLKRRYIETFGNAYECPSPRAGELNALVEERCRRAGIECDPKAVFAYLHTLEGNPVGEQLSFLD